KIRIPNFKIQSLGRAKRKGVGGKEFLPALAFSAPQFFVFRFTKCVAKKEVVFTPPSRAHTTINSLVKIKEKMYSNSRVRIQGFIILLYHTIIIIQV
ncbi:MAG: hypothetical protein COX31_01610, partial [Candidatus Moranbacteria bacterium CG23_combo_of_CG06-09_8_20_14_all_40_16]